MSSIECIPATSSPGSSATSSSPATRSPYRKAIIKRWHELEAKEASNPQPIPVIPQIIGDALRLPADLSSKNGGPASGGSAERRLPGQSTKPISKVPGTRHADVLCLTRLFEIGMTLSTSVSKSRPRLGHPRSRRLRFSLALSSISPLQGTSAPSPLYPDNPGNLLRRHRSPRACTPGATERSH